MSPALHKRAIYYLPDVNDLEKQCSGCRICEMLCSMEHAGGCSHVRSRIRIIALNSSEQVPVTCLQCTDAPCVEACPMEAISNDPVLGIPLIHDDKCIGCLACVSACPFGAMGVDPDTGKVAKCDLCQGEPLCVKYCPSRVLSMADWEDLTGKKARFFVRSGVDARRRLLQEVRK